MLEIYKHTFKADICLRPIPRVLQWHFKLLLDHLRGLGVVLFFFPVPIIKLNDEIIKLSEYCDDGHCIRSIFGVQPSMTELNYGQMPHTVPRPLLVKKPLLKFQ